MPAIDGLIALAFALNGQDDRRDGRTLEGLGLGGLSRDALLPVVMDGDRARRVRQAVREDP